MPQEENNQNGNVQRTNDVTDQQQTLSWRRFIIGPIVGIYMLGYMMSFYTITEYTNKVWRDKKLSDAKITTNLTTGNGCAINESNLEVKVLKEASSMASQYTVYYSLAQGIPAIVSNLILGSYTDAFGRKFLLAVGISGTTLRVILSFCIIYFKMDLLFFLGACLVEGITGQYVTTFQVGLAYISDVTKTGNQRTYGVAYIIFNLSFFVALASLVAGFLIEEYSFYASFLVAGVLLMLTFIIMLTLLPESLPPTKRLTNKSFSTVLYNSFSFFISDDFGNNKWKYRLILLAHAVCDFSFLGRIGVDTLYQLADPFCWNVEKVGWYGTARILGINIFSVALVGVYKIFLSDISLASIGTLSYAASFLLTGLAKSDNMLYAAGAVNCFGGLEATTVRGVVSSMTSPQQQGALFSAFASVEVIVNLLSNVGTSGIYSLSVEFMRGFVFFVLAGLDIIAFALFVILQIGLKMEKKQIKIERIAS